MHLKSLKIFCDVVGRRSFSRAADDNGISQSGVSQAVLHLEEHLGVKLLDRSKRPFVLTPVGEVYYEGCRKLVQRYYSLEEEVRALHEKVEGRVRVASIYSVGLSYMNVFLRRFREKYPKTQVGLDYQPPERVYELVRNDQVDVGLVSYPRSSRDINVIAWRQEPMVVVCSPDHELAQRKSLRLAELKGRDMVGFNDSLRIRREIDKALGTHNVDVRVVMQFDNIETLKRAIEINAGISLLPEVTVRRESVAETLVAISISDVVLTRPLGVIYRRGHDLGTTARRFIELLTAETEGVRTATQSNGNDENETRSSHDLQTTSAASKSALETEPV